MRKIHITEEQLNALKKQIEEQNELTIDAQPDPNGKVSTQGLKTQYTNAKSQTGGNTNIKLSVDGADLSEGEYKAFTKKQLKEARLRYLKENSTVYKKGNVK